MVHVVLSGMSRHSLLWILVIFVKLMCTKYKRTMKAKVPCVRNIGNTHDTMLVNEYTCMHGYVPEFTRMCLRYYSMVL
jgi:hypothetical protein